MNCIFCSTEFKSNQPVIIYQDVINGEQFIEVERFNHEEEAYELVETTADTYDVKTYMYCPHCGNFYLSVIDEVEGHFFDEKYYWIGNTKDNTSLIMDFSDTLIRDELDKLKTYEVKMENEVAVEIIGLKEEQEEQAKKQFTSDDDDENDELPF